VLPTDFPQIRKLIIQLWPRCENDWTAEMWSVLAEQVRRLDVEQATAIVREVRATQGKGWAPDIATSTKRARQTLSALPDKPVVRFDKPDPNERPAKAHFANVRDGAEWHLRNRHEWENEYPPEVAAMLCQKFSAMLGGAA
jgi:hypothetical protein